MKEHNPESTYVPNWTVPEAPKSKPLGPLLVAAFGAGFAIVLVAILIINHVN